MGVERADIEDEIDDRAALAGGASFDYALGDVLFGKIIKGWTKVPYTDEPDGGFPNILKEWGS